jgi:hypothetical protein
MKYTDQELSDLIVVPEEIIKHCANQVDLMYVDEGNNFKLCLQYGSQFKEAGLTPLYLCKPNMKDVYVTSMEKFESKFH